MTDEPDIAIGARVKAKRLRFRSKPQVDVEFTGDARDESSGSERRNLPEEVEPGVTYRDVEVGWHAAARFDPRVDPRVDDR